MSTTIKNLAGGALASLVGLALLGAAAVLASDAFIAVPRSQRAAFTFVRVPAVVVVCRHLGRAPNGRTEMEYAYAEPGGSGLTEVEFPRRGATLSYFEPCYPGLENTAPAGTRTTVLVNPADPGESVMLLTPGGPFWIRMEFLIWTSILGACFAAVGPVALLHKLRPPTTDGLPARDDGRLAVLRGPEMGPWAAGLAVLLVSSVFCTPLVFNITEIRWLGPLVWLGQVAGSALVAWQVARRHRLEPSLLTLDRAADTLTLPRGSWAGGSGGPQGSSVLQRSDVLRVRLVQREVPGRRSTHTETWLVLALRDDTEAWLWDYGPDTDTAKAAEAWVCRSLAVDQSTVQSR